ncbi:MAG TPA: MarR family transcriptional regulator [Candidatus Saccharimonadales bacterium]|nr:MarR family transcriptional regulator [Candidatus Saccharimonadales bacterium]
MKQQLLLADKVRVMLQAACAANRQLLETALKGYRLSTAQAEVISILSIEGQLNIKQIGQMITCEKSSPSRLLARMKGEGLVYISKNPDDKRSSLVRLTPRGEQLAEIIDRVNFTIDINTSKRLTTNEQLQLEILLAKLSGQEL